MGRLLHSQNKLSAGAWATISTGLVYKGLWNANTNSPAIASGVGIQGDYYIVGTAGTTTIDGESDWGLGDWIIFNGTAWQKLDNSELWSDDGTDYTTTFPGRNIDFGSGLLKDSSVIAGIALGDVLNTTLSANYTASTIMGALNEARFDQDLNTTDGVTFDTLSLTTSLTLDSNTFDAVVTGTANNDVIPTQGYVDDAVDSPGSKVLWVDLNRTDSYTEDGSVLRPFKTIMGAVNQVITNADNATYTYDIEIMNGNYVENIILENALLYYLNFKANGVVSNTPASGNAFQSTTLNTNLQNLHIQGITFRKPFVITGQNGDASFTDVILTDCNFPTGATIGLTCVNTFTVRGGYIETAITYNNVNWSWVEGTQVQGNWSFTMDSTGAVPSQGSAGTLLFTGGFFSGTPSFTIGGVATYTVAPTGSRFGNSAVTVPAGVTIIAYSSLLRGTWTNNGALNLRGSFAQGLAGTDPVITYQPASQIYNDSTLVTGTNVKNALETLKNTSEFNTIHVSKNGNDTTGTGSELNPYLTIQKAIDYIASVAVIGQDWTIAIYTGQYVENLLLENTGLYSIFFEGIGVVGVVPASGNSLQSTTNNGNLSKFYMRNIEFTRPVIITGPNAGTCFSVVWWKDCKFVTNSTITATCINNLSLETCYNENAISLSNVNWFYYNGRTTDAFSMTCDSTANAPSAGFNCTSMFSGVYSTGAVTLTKIGTATGVLVLIGSRLNSSSGTIVNPVGWTVQLYGSHLRGNFTNNGTLNLRTGFVEKTLTSTGTLTLDQPASQIKDDSSLAQGNVKLALEYLAGLITGSVLTFTSQSATYTALTTDQIIEFTGAGGYDCDLFTAVGNTGQHLWIDNNSSGNVTLDPDGAETIDGVPYIILSAGEKAHIYVNGTEWRTM